MSTQQAETTPIYRNARAARTAGKNYTRMAREVAGYPEHEGQHEHVSELRGRAAHAYRTARALEANEPEPVRREKPKQPEPWTPRRALRRAGVRTAQRADQAARNAPRKARRAVQRSGAVTNLGGGPQGAGGFVVYVFASILLLLLLDVMLGGRGPAAVQKSLGFLTGAIQKLVSASDPLIAQGQLPATAPASTASAASTPAPTAANPRAAQTFIHTVKGG